MPPILVNFPPSNSVAFLLAVTMLLGSGGVNVSFWVGEDFENIV